MEDEQKLNENEQKSYERCVKKLEGMNQVPVDCRPKTLAKLNNTLENEGKVIYVVDVLSILLQMDFQSVVGKEFVKVYRTDKQLDHDIVMYAKEQALKQSKQLFVLPCDSTLQKNLIQNVENWCARRDEIRVDPMSPSRDLAMACVFDSQIDQYQVYNALETLGIVNAFDNMVFIDYPEKNAMEGLKKTFNKWNDQMKYWLSNKPEDCFAHLLKETNEELQHKTIDGINDICLNAVESLFPRSTRTDDVMDTDDVSDAQGTSDGNKSTASKNIRTGTSTSDEVFNQPLFLWPVSLQPEVVFILLKLYDSDKTQTTVSELTDFIRENGNIMYVGSPKHALIELAGEDMTDKSRLDRDRGIGLNVYMGLDFIREYNDTTTWLASVLAAPKKKTSKKDKMDILDEKFNKMSTSTDRVKEQLSNFQKHVLQTVKHRALSTGSLLLYNNDNAKKRSSETLKKFVDTQLLYNRDEFYQTIIKSCYEHADVPTGDLVDLLIKRKYLKVGDKIYKKNQIDWEIEYLISPYFPSSSVDDTQTEHAFLQHWEMWYRPPANQNSNQETGICCSPRKRRNYSCGSCNGGKRPRTVKEIDV